MPVWIVGVTFLRVNVGPMEYQLTKAEKRFAWLPGWIPGVVSRPLPEAIDTGPRWIALERMHGASLRLASRWNDALTAFPMIPAMGIFLCGAIQLTAAVALEINGSSGSFELSSWFFVCLGIFSSSSIPFVATYAVHDKRWRARAPFEWLYVKQCLWVLHHLRMASTKGEYRATFHALDGLERLLVNRFLPLRTSAPPSLKLANDRWHVRMRPLISEKARFYGNPQDIQSPEAIHKWIEKSAELVSTPISAWPALGFLWGIPWMPRGETSLAAESALPEPHSMSRLLGVLTLSAALMFGFAVLYESLQGRAPIIQETEQAAKIGSAVTTIVVQVASLYVIWKQRKN